MTKRRQVDRRVSGVRRLECGCRVTYPEVPPQVGDAVWCWVCDRAAVVSTTERGNAA